MKETFTAYSTIGHLEAKVDDGKALRICREGMAGIIAQGIIDKAFLTSTHDDYSTTYRMHLIVADIDDYYRDIEERAMELSRLVNMQHLRRT